MNFKNLGYIILAASWLCALTPHVQAQTAIDMQRVKNAETMTFAGRCVEAIVQVRELYDKYPRNEQIATALKNAYVCSKDYDSALAVLQRLVSTSGEQFQKVSYQLDIAGIYFRQGNVVEGRKQIDSAISLLPYDVSSYERAADAFMMNGYYADAVKFLQESRARLNQPSVFSRKLAQLYEIMRSYGEAAREYFVMVEGDSTQEIYVTGRISNLIKLDAQEEFDTGLEKALAEIVKSNPNRKEAHRFDGDYLIAQGEYEKALERFRLVDSLENGLGKNLLYFARTARDNGAYEMVEEACAQIAAQPKSPFVIQSRFILAESHFARGSYAQAATIYQEILDLSPSDRDKSEALYSLGLVTLQGLHDPQNAIATFDQIIQKYPRLPLAAAARVLIGDCYLAQGNATMADSIYAGVKTSQLPVRNQEELLFKRAELQFYTGNFEAARDAYGKMMNAFPKSVFVNDCLRRIMLISEYGGMDEASLQIFATALYSQFRFEYQKTLDELAKLKGRSGAILPELAWLKSGEIYQTLKQDTLALAEYDSLITLHPASFYTPIAFERKGDIYSESQHNCEQARQMYQQVLLNHPGSLNVEDVRKKLQRAEKTICVQDDKAKS